MRFIDATVFILLKRNVIVEAVSDKNYIECVLLTDEEGVWIDDAPAYLLVKRKRREGVCDLFKNQKVVFQQSL